MMLRLPVSPLLLSVVTGHIMADNGAALAATLPVSRPAVSQHLRVLREAGLVVGDPAGTRRLYTTAVTVERREGGRLYESIEGGAESDWDPVLARYVEAVAT